MDILERAEKEKKLDERAKQRARDDVKFLLGDERGRRFIWDLICRCGVYHDFDVTNPNIMAKQAGKRQVGLEILGILTDVDELQVFKMMQEARNMEIDEREIINEWENNDRNNDRTNSDTSGGTGSYDSGPIDIDFGDSDYSSGNPFL